MKSHVLLILLLFCTDLAFAQWNDRKSNLPVPWGTGWAIDAREKNIAVVALTKGVWLTRDAGQTWLTLGYSNTNGTAVDVAAPDDKHVWVASDVGRFLQWNAATGVWQKQYDDTAITAFMNCIQMFDTLNGIAMGDAKAEGLPAVFLRTTDGGLHWMSVNVDMEPGYHERTFNASGLSSGVYFYRLNASGSCRRRAFFC
jgi:photosystem II stability/assembly factor-like uncharacterized protein